MPTIRPAPSAVAPATLVLAALLGLAACGGPSADEGGATTPGATRPAVAPPIEGGEAAYEIAGHIDLSAREAEERPGVLNLFQLAPDLWSGSEPHGEEGLRTVAALGVRTIVSTDGKAPDVETAQRLGLRYVHIPIQYSGVTPDEMLRLAKTFRELEPPFYVHCFHGKHRGPTGAAIARLVRDGVTREQALAEMRLCGTSPKYAGLYEAIGRAAFPSEAETAAYAYDFPPEHLFRGFRAGMINISRAWDHLLDLEKRGWTEDPEHPDVSPVNEAAKLADFFDRASSLEEVAARPDDFRGWMEAGTDGAQALHEALLGLGEGGGAEATAAAFAAVKDSCNACHKVYRDHR